MAHANEPPLDKSLRKLQRSTSAFSVLAVIVLSVVFASSIWTNYKVIALTGSLRRTQAHLVAVQNKEATDTRLARRSSCLQSNDLQRQAIGASDAHDQIEANAISPPPRSPEAETRVVSALGAEHNAALAEHPRRDCTPAGIAKYLGLTPSTKEKH